MIFSKKNFSIKKIFLFVFVLFLFFSFYNDIFATCTPNADWWFDVGDALDSCLDGTSLVDWTNAKIDWTWGFSDKIKWWVNNIGIYLWIIAVWSIVYWALLLTLSSGEDEKIKKAKDIIIWWTVWFIWLISASAIINLVVKIMYSL